MNDPITRAIARVTVDRLDPEAAVELLAAEVSEALCRVAVAGEIADRLLTTHPELGDVLDRDTLATLVDLVLDEVREAAEG